MLKALMMMSFVGLLAIQNVAEAQRRGQGMTRGERDRIEQRDRYRQYTPPPIVIVPQHRPAPLMSLIQQAANGMIAGCEVRLRVSGWANQLSVQGVFSGNFEAGSEDVLLAQAIDARIYRGVCRQRSPAELGIIGNPNLIEDFAQGMSRNCFVKMNVSGWANQLYINGAFNGNFDCVSERQRLHNTLADLVLTGRCDY